MHWAVYWPEERNDIFEQATIVARGVEKVKAMSAAEVEPVGLKAN